MQHMPNLRGEIKLNRSGSSSRLTYPYIFLTFGLLGLVSAAGVGK
jgi:hypothetical protein